MLLKLCLAPVVFGLCLMFVLSLVTICKIVNVWLSNVKRGFRLKCPDIYMNNAKLEYVENTHIQYSQYIV